LASAFLKVFSLSNFLISLMEFLTIFINLTQPKVRRQHYKL
jgi:hypothetical protein